MMAAVDRINALARDLHGSDTVASEYTLASLAAHVQEVKELRQKDDPHWQAETMDIIIHALTLLRRGGVGERRYEALMDERSARFVEKISAALKKG